VDPTRNFHLACQQFDQAVAAFELAIHNRTNTTSLRTQLESVFTRLKQTSVAAVAHDDRLREKVSAAVNRMRVCRAMPLHTVLPRPFHQAQAESTSAKMPEYRYAPPRDNNWTHTVFILTMIEEQIKQKTCSAEHLSGMAQLIRGLDLDSLTADQQKFARAKLVIIQRRMIELVERNHPKKLAWRDVIAACLISILLFKFIIMFFY
jgi:hypothetical protein